MIQYSCPSCGTPFEFRKRVTISKRRCPHCNHEVTTLEIDKQVTLQVEQQRKTSELREQQRAIWFVVLGIIGAIAAIVVAASGKDPGAICCGGSLFLTAIGAIALFMGSRKG